MSFDYFDDFFMEDVFFAGYAGNPESSQTRMHVVHSCWGCGYRDEYNEENEGDLRNICNLDGILLAELDTIPEWCSLRVAGHRKYIVEKHGYKYLYDIYGGIYPDLSHVETYIAIINKDFTVFEGYHTLLNDYNLLYECLVVSEWIRRGINFIKCPKEEELHKIILRSAHNPYLSDANREYVRRIVSQYNKKRPKETEEIKHINVKDGWVYVLKSPNNNYKIGMTTRTPGERLCEFAPKLPFEVEYLFAIKSEKPLKLEKSLHKKHHEKRVNGEWFSLNEEDIEQMRVMAKEANYD